MLQTRLLPAPAAKGSTPLPARPFRSLSVSARAGAAAFTCAGPRGRGCRHPKAGAERPPRKVEGRQGTERYGLCRRTRCLPGTSKGRRQAGSEPASGSTKQPATASPTPLPLHTRVHTHISTFMHAQTPRAHTNACQATLCLTHLFLPGAGVRTGENCPSPRGRVPAGPYLPKSASPWPLPSGKLLFFFFNLLNDRGKRNLSVIYKRKSPPQD